MEKIKIINPNPRGEYVLQRNDNPKFTYANIKEMAARSLEELSFEFNPVKDWKFTPINTLTDWSSDRHRVLYTEDFFINNIFRVEDGEMDLNNVMKDRITYRNLITLKKSVEDKNNSVKGNDFYYSITKILESNFDNLYEIEWKHVSDEEMDRITDILNDLKILLERRIDLCKI